MVHSGDRLCRLLLPYEYVPSLDTFTVSSWRKGLHGKNKMQRRRPQHKRQQQQQPADVSDDMPWVRAPEISVDEKHPGGVLNKVERNKKYTPESVHKFAVAANPLA